MAHMSYGQGIEHSIFDTIPDWHQILFHTEVSVTRMSLELKYWNGRGLMEVPRMLLAIAGKFPVSSIVVS